MSRAISAKATWWPCAIAAASNCAGLTNYSAADAGRIIGLRTEQIGEVSGAVPYEEMVHRDNLVIVV